MKSETMEWILLLKSTTILCYTPLKLISRDIQGGVVKKWTMKMFKFDSDSGVLCYCDAASYQKSNQVW